MFTIFFLGFCSGVIAMTFVIGLIIGGKGIEGEAQTCQEREGGKDEGTGKACGGKGGSCHEETRAEREFCRQD